jgi:small subunit ribosomal protein S6
VTVGNPEERRDPDMRDYEIVFIVHPDLDETSFQEIIERVQGWITGGSGTVGKVDVWGKKQLAYRIRKQREGQYVLIEAQMPPAFVMELERNFRITEPVLRYLVTVKK